VQLLRFLVQLNDLISQGFVLSLSRLRASVSVVNAVVEVVLDVCVLFFFSSHVCSPIIAGDTPKQCPSGGADRRIFSNVVPIAGRKSYHGAYRSTNEGAKDATHDRSLSACSLLVRGTSGKRKTKNDSHGFEANRPPPKCDLRFLFGDGVRS
jgi:hypothetical protein